MITKGLSPSHEGRARIYKELGITKETLQQDVEAIKDWLLKQPHLPDLSSLNLDHWLENLLLLTKNSVERTKTVADLYISARSICPVLFTNRDPSDRMLRESFNYVTIAILPGLTEEGHRVFLMKITDPNPDHYDLETIMKRCLMMMDTYLKDGVDFTGMHIVHDLEHFRLGHLTKFNLTLMRVMTLGMKAYPFRMPRITMVNTPSHLDKLLAIFRPFMSAKIMSRVTTYKDASQLMDLVPPDVVPKDYGGTGPGLDEVNGMWRDRLDQNKEYFAKCDALKSDESRRMGKRVYSHTDFGQNGSFRQLSVD